MVPGCCTTQTVCHKRKKTNLKPPNRGSTTRLQKAVRVPVPSIDTHVIFSLLRSEPAVNQVNVHYKHGGRFTSDHDFADITDFKVPSHHKLALIL